MEAVVLLRVGFLAHSCPKQGQDFKPSAAPLYPNMSQVPPPRGTPVLSKTDLLKADLLFVKFGERFEQLYGKKAVTPNMHLHCHLKECVIDCGPVHAFWCFSFEQFNGILGAMQVNGRVWRHS